MRASTPLRDFGGSADELPSFYSHRTSNDSNISSIHFGADESRRDSKTYDNQLKEQISHWLYEMPIDLDTSENRDEFLGVLISLLHKRRPSDENMKKDIIDWLGKHLKDQEYRQNMPEMADKLINRLRRLPPPQRMQSPLQGSMHLNISVQNRPYTEPIKKEVLNWVNKLPIDLKNDPELRDLMVNELVSEIVDRQVYLENNPSKALSENEENEYIEYQIYRWLFKLPSDVVSPAQLVERYGSIVSELVSKIRQHTNTILPYAEQVEKEIGDWLKNIPKSVQMTGNVKERQTMAGELAKKIEQLQKGTDVVRKIDNEIEEWVKKIIKLPKGQAKVIESIESLKTIIRQIPYHADQAGSVNRSSFMKYTKKLEGNINEWLNNLPVQPNLNPNFDTEKPRLIKDLAVKLCDIYGKYESVQQEDFMKNKIVEEVADWLKHVPLDPTRASQKERERFAEYMYNAVKNVCLMSGGENLYNANSGPSSQETPWSGSLNQSNQIHRQLNPQEAAQLLSQEIANWCDELPIIEDAEKGVKREAILLDLVFKIFRKVYQLASHPATANDDVLFNTVLLEVLNKMLDILPQNNELMKIKRPMAEKLVKKIAQYKHCFRPEVADPEINLSINQSQVQPGVNDKLYENIIAWCKHWASFTPELPQEQLFQQQTEMVFGIFKKLFELADMKLISDDPRLTQDLICEEIERLIDNYPKNDKLEAKKHQLALMITNTLYHFRHIFTAGRSGYEQRESVPVQNTDNTSNYVRPSAFLEATDFGGSPRQGIPGRVGHEYSVNTEQFSLLGMSPVDASHWSARNIDAIPEQFRVGTPAHTSFRGTQEHVSFRPRSQSESKKLLSEEIVQWCNQLPVPSQSEREQLQVDLLFKVFRKAFQIAHDPAIFNNNAVFEELIQQEITALLNSVPIDQEMKYRYANELAKKIGAYKDCFLPSDRGQQQTSGRPCGSSLCGTPAGYQTFQDNAPFSSSHYRPALEGSIRSGGHQQSMYENTRIEQPLQDADFTSLYSTRISRSNMDADQFRQSNILSSPPAQMTSLRPNYAPSIPTTPNYDLFEGQVPFASSHRPNEQSFQNPRLQQCHSECQRKGNTQLSKTIAGISTGDSGVQRSPYDFRTQTQTRPNSANASKNFQLRENPRIALNDSQIPGTSGQRGIETANLYGEAQGISRSMRDRSRHGTIERSINIEGNIQGSPNEELQSSWQPRTRSKTTSSYPARSISMDDLAPEGFSTPVSQPIPNRMPQRPTKRTRGTPIEEYEDDEDYDGNALRLKCQCKDVTIRGSGTRSVGVCLRPSCLSCNINSAMTQCPRCCGVHCPFPSFLYFR